MRRINTYDARECTQADERTLCRCRCDGTLHGKSHASLIRFEDEILEKGRKITKIKIEKFLTLKAKKRGGEKNEKRNT